MADSTGLQRNGHRTREGWLVAAIDLLDRDIMREAGAPKLPDDLMVSCGWPKGGKDNRIGEHWNPAACVDSKTHHLFISPVLTEVVQVLATLLHELIHAVHPDAKHGKVFKKTATACGLVGKMRATEPGPELVEKLQKMALRLGDYPHAGLQGKERHKPAKGESQWLRLYSREDPEYKVNIKREMLEEHGPPTDPWGNQMVPEEELVPRDEDSEEEGE